MGHALTVVVAGDNVSIAAGTYSDDDITFPAVDNITITGAGIGATIFDGDNDGSSLQRFITISGSVTGLTISDMTIQDMDVSGNGGGFNVTTTGSVTFQDIYFKACVTKSSYQDGGAIYVSSSSTASVDRCKFTDCSTQYTGAAYSNGSCIYSEGTTTIQNCLAYNNLCGYASSNGLIYINGGSTNVYNCTFTENTPSYTGLIYINTATTVNVSNTIIYNNSCSASVKRVGGTVNFNYSLYDDVPSGTITLNANDNSSNPNFTNSATDNFTLNSGSTACLNTGTSAGMPTYDLLQATRPYGGGYDMGCYEYSPVYYWVGGSGNWIADAATHWATSSGGAGMHGSAPTSADNVIFDANSTGTITVDASASSSNFTSTGSTATIAGSSDLNVYGNLTIGSGFT